MLVMISITLFCKKFHYTFHLRFDYTFTHNLERALSVLKGLSKVIASGCYDNLIFLKNLLYVNSRNPGVTLDESVM